MGRRGSEEGVSCVLMLRVISAQTLTRCSPGAFYSQNIHLQTLCCSVALCSSTPPPAGRGSSLDLKGRIHPPCNTFVPGAAAEPLAERQHRALLAARRGPEGQAEGTLLKGLALTAQSQHLPVPAQPPSPAQSQPIPAPAQSIAHSPPAQLPRRPLPCSPPPAGQTPAAHCPLLLSCLP